MKNSLGETSRGQGRPAEGWGWTVDGVVLGRHLFRKVDVSAPGADGAAVAGAPGVSAASRWSVVFVLARDLLLDGCQCCFCRFSLGCPEETLPREAGYRSLIVL